MIESKKMKLHVLLLAVFLFFQLILLTNLAKYAIIKTRANHAEEDDQYKESSSSVVQETAVPKETSENQIENSQHSSETQFDKCDLNNDGVVNKDDFADWDLKHEEFIKLNLNKKAWEELTEEEHQLYDCLDVDGNHKINNYDGTTIKKQCNN